MTTTPQDEQQADLERMVTRIAQRAADNVAGLLADLGRQLALAQESLDGHVLAKARLEEQVADKDAELARAHQVADELRARVVELENPPPTDDEQTPTD